MEATSAAEVRSRRSATASAAAAARPLGHVRHPAPPLAPRARSTTSARTAGPPLAPRITHCEQRYRSAAPTLGASCAKSGEVALTSRSAPTQGYLRHPKTAFLGREVPPGASSAGAPADRGDSLAKRRLAPNRRSRGHSDHSAFPRPMDAPRGRPRRCRALPHGIRRALTPRARRCSFRQPNAPPATPARGRCACVIWSAAGSGGADGRQERVRPTSSSVNASRCRQPPEGTMSTKRQPSPPRSYCAAADNGSYGGRVAVIEAVAT